MIEIGAHELSICSCHPPYHSEPTSHTHSYSKQVWQVWSAESSEGKCCGYCISSMLFRMLTAINRITCSAQVFMMHGSSELHVAVYFLNIYHKAPVAGPSRSSAARVPHQSRKQGPPVVPMLPPRAARVFVVKSRIDAQSTQYFGNALSAISDRVAKMFCLWSHI